MFSMLLFKGSAAYIGYHVHMHTYTDVCKNYNQHLGQEEGWLGHTQCYTGVPMFPCNCSEGMEHTQGVRWRCIHLPKCVHILTRVWDQERSNLDTQCNTRDRSTDVLL